MTQLQLKELLVRANRLLEKGISILPGFVVIRRSKMENILDNIDASIPEDIKEASRILARKEQMLADAQNRADRIILDAQNEYTRMLSESEIMRGVQSAAIQYKEQVVSECDSIKSRTAEELEAMKAAAFDEAQKIREGAENYAEQVLANMASDLDHIHSVVRNGQDYLEQMKEDARLKNKDLSNSLGYTSKAVDEKVQFEVV